jgi:ankyrin repeat protein
VTLTARWVTLRARAESSLGDAESSLGDDISQVRRLLGAGADAGAVDSLGWTALQKAMARRHVEVANIIVKALKEAQGETS